MQDKLKLPCEIKGGVSVLSLFDGMSCGMLAFLKLGIEPSIDNGSHMTIDPTVRHMKSSPKANPVPFSMITNVFDYNKIKEQAKTEFDAIRQQEMAKMAQLREQQLMSLSQSVLADENTMGKVR